tara:strand:+ start:87 stop:422 length:336 start_codon:yes stop_codon:yes gene_type:complete
MEKVNGAGVTERSEDWTIRSVFEDWIADRELSRRKKAFLETTHTQMMHVLENEACMEPNVAPAWMRDEIDEIDISFECHCVAALLDHLSPRKEQMSREQEIYIALDEAAFL